MRRIARVLGLNRSTFYRHRKAGEPLPPAVDEDLACQIKSVIDDSRFPGYGYRRAWAVLRFDRGVEVGKEKIRRIMRLKRWQAKPIPRPKRYGGMPYDRDRRVVDPQARIRTEQPDQRWCTDLTRFYVGEAGWVNLIPVLDCCTAEVLGFRVSLRGRALEAREVLEAAVLERFGAVCAIPEGLCLRTDNGSIFLAKAYWDELKRLGIEPEYTPYHCPSANGMAERFMRTIKEECIWQHNFQTLQEAEEVIEKWIGFYNTRRRHSSLGYRTPAEYRETLRYSAA